MSEKDRYYDSTLLCGFLKNFNIKDIYIHKIETDLQIQKASLWLPKRRGKRAGTN